MPPALHAELARSAERESTSLNQFITTALAATIGWRDGAERPASPAGEPRGEADGARHRQLVVVALFANVVVIGLAAIAAIAILLVAWLG